MCQVGLITGTRITGSGLVLPSVYFLYWKRPGPKEQEAELLGGPVFYMDWPAMLYTAAFFGVVLFVFVMASTYYSIVTTSFAGR